MGKVLAVSLAVLVAVVVPPVLVVNALRLLATETFVEAVLGRDGFPPDRFGLSSVERERLALLGLRSIQPGSDGIVLLEQARLPDGSEAFGERELTHMEDVRAVFGAALRAQLVVLVALLCLALGLARTRLRATVPLGLLAGALGTLAIAVLAVPFILLGFDRFFTRFHEVFFEGDSWRFSTSDTLIRLYPEQLWRDVSIVAALLTVAQALLVAPTAWWWRGRAARERS